LTAEAATHELVDLAQPRLVFLLVCSSAGLAGEVPVSRLPDRHRTPTIEPAGEPERLHSSRRRSICCSSGLRREQCLPAKVGRGPRGTRGVRLVITHTVTDVPRWRRRYRVRVTPGAGGHAPHEFHIMIAARRRCMDYVRSHSSLSTIQLFQNVHSCPSSSANLYNVLGRTGGRESAETPAADAVRAFIIGVQHLGNRRILADSTGLAGGRTESIFSKPHLLKPLTLAGKCVGSEMRPSVSL
jgi:hypothetical protein